MDGVSSSSRKTATQSQQFGGSIIFTKVYFIQYSFEMRPYALNEEAAS
jgi:hypothetical protein